MNTGESIGATCMDQKKSQILGHLVTKGAWVLPGNVTDQDWLSRLPETKETYTCQNWLARPVHPLKEFLQIFSVREVNT